MLLLLPLWLLTVVEIPLGTPVKVYLNAPLTHVPLSEGQTVSCLAHGTVRIQGHIVIGHGVPAYARIVEIDRGRRKNVRGVLMEVVEVQATDGQMVPLKGAPVYVAVEENSNGIGQLLSAVTGKRISVEVNDP